MGDEMARVLEKKYPAAWRLFPQFSEPVLSDQVVADLARRHHISAGYDLETPLDEASKRYFYLYANLDSSSRAWPYKCRLSAEFFAPRLYPCTRQIKSLGRIECSATFLFHCIARNLKEGGALRPTSNCPLLLTQA